MNPRSHLLLLLATAVVAGKLQAQSLQLREQKVSAPEMGEILTLVLVNGALEYPFVPPADWRASLEHDRHRMVLQSADRAASITVALASSNPALHSKADPAELRNLVLSRYRNGRITAEFPCYTSSHAGKAFDVEWTGPGRVPMASRLAFFPTSTGSLEFTLTTMSGQFPTVRPVLGRLLTSFQENGVKPGSPAKPAS